MAATPAATPGKNSRLRHIPLYERILARPAAGAAIIVVFVWIVFALLGGGSGFLTAEGTLSYLDVAARAGRCPDRAVARARSAPVWGCAG